jgi:cephalosporin-C deacetylase-like acetyl esterase
MTARSASVAKLSTRAEVEARQRFIRSWITDAMGGFPARTPLNARITGSFERDGYRVEKLVFESLPGFYVTANVYVPTTGKTPYPAVLGVAGHSASGKAIDTYQYAFIGLAKKGFVVLAFDPPGQGERSEYFDPVRKKSSVGIGVPEHNMAGAQCLLTGTTIARYETWDGIRAFDYLLTRKDVDPKRIGVAGNSGGGTQAAYLAVLEPRLAAVVTSCYITSWKMLWHVPGPQDAEQNFPGFLRAGLDFGDFLIAFAPRPIQMLTAIQDYFPIEGARATFAEVRRTFEAIDAPGKAGYFEYDDKHGWSKPRREATYRWMMKWLQGRDEDGAEAAITPEAEAVLNVTNTGQVSTSLGGTTVRSLNQKLAEELYAKRKPLKVAQVAQRIGFEGVDGDLKIDAELHAPPGAKHLPAVISIGQGGAEIERMVSAGRVVLALRMRGASGGKVDKATGYTPQWQTANRAMLVGKTIVGIQVSDVLAAFRHLLTREEVAAEKIAIHGVGNAGVVALYAAVLEPRIASVTVENALLSYMTAVRAGTHKDLIDVVVPGVLRDFDLPDLAGKIAPRPLTITGARDAMGEPLALPTVQAEFGVAVRAYAQRRATSALRITVQQ